jgi:hypothetical protein
VENFKGFKVHSKEEVVIVVQSSIIRQERNSVITEICKRLCLFYLMKNKKKGKESQETNSYYFHFRGKFITPSRGSLGGRHHHQFHDNYSVEERKGRDVGRM